MATNGNNKSEKIAHVRDSFFDSDEKEYFSELIKDPNEKGIHLKLMKENVKQLYKKACDLIVRVEQGEFTEEEMEKVERIIAHCLGAIEDFEHAKELELTL